MTEFAYHRVLSKDIRSNSSSESRALHVIRLSHPLIISPSPRFHSPIQNRSGRVQPSRFSHRRRGGSDLHQLVLCFVLSVFRISFCSGEWTLVANEKGCSYHRKVPEAVRFRNSQVQRFCKVPLVLLVRIRSAWPCVAAGVTQGLQCEP